MCRTKSISNLELELLSKRSIDGETLHNANEFRNSSQNKLLHDPDEIVFVLNNG